MKKIMIFISAGILMIFSSILPGEEYNYIAHLSPNIKSLWDQRSDINSTEKLYAILKTKFSNGVTDESTLILFPRLAFWYVENLMDRGVTDKKTLLSIADPGIKAGQKCIKLYPKEAGCYFWYGVILSRAQGIRGVSPSTIPMLKTMMRVMNIVEKTDPAYFYGGVYRYWGRVIYEVPWLIRKLAGHSLKEAVEFYKKSIKIEPNFLMSHVYLAEVYIKMKKYNLARNELEFAIKTPSNLLPDVIPENKRWKRKAFELRKKYYSDLYGK